MKRNSRFSAALHVLVHLAEPGARPATSEFLAACLMTNPVVVRRTMAGLRNAGIVASARGHGGGWQLARPAGEITLADVCRALDERLVLPALATESPGCLVEQSVNGALTEVFAEAEVILARRLARVTLADIAADVGRLTKERNAIHA